MDNYPVKEHSTPEERLASLEREVLALRSDFQQLEQVLHTMHEHFENEIGNIKEEL